MGWSNHQHLMFLLPWQSLPNLRDGLPDGRFLLAQVGDHRAILAQVHDLLQAGLHPHPINGAQFAKVHRILPKSAIPLNQTAHLVEADRVSNVVAQQVAASHRVTKKDNDGMSPTIHAVIILACRTNMRR